MNIEEMIKHLQSANLTTEEVRKLPVLVMECTAHELLHKEFFAAPLAAVPKPEKDEELLEPVEAARMLGTTVKWLYAHKRQLPHVSLSGRQLRFPRKGLQKYIAARINSRS